MAVVLLLYLVTEVAAIWAVASTVGALWTIALLLAGAFIGSWLARREGGKAARALFAASRAGESGHKEITDGMLIALGGLLILLPGFVTDVAGLLLLLPPTRALFRRKWLRKLEASRLPGYQRTQRVVVVEGEVVQEPSTGPDPDPAGAPREPGPGRVIEG